jgi:hypothetical protein
VSVTGLRRTRGLRSGNNEAAGKRKSSRIPKGHVYLKTALAETAQSAAEAKRTYLRDKFYSLKPRRGYKRAAVAVAHKILVAIYQMLSNQVNSTNSATVTWTRSISTPSPETWFIAWNVSATS